MTTQDLDDISTNLTNNRPISSILEAETSRRGALRGGLLGAASFMGAMAITKTASAAPNAAPVAASQGSLLGDFTPIATSTADEVVVPDGYSAQPFLKWGEPIVPSGPAWKKDASATPQEAEQQLGQGHDGMRYFPINGSSTHGLLALNHEYILRDMSHAPGDTEWDHDKTVKEMNQHGVTVVEIKLDENGQWAQVESDYARRITAFTPMKFSGPAVGSDLFKTEADPAGDKPLGTINNCGNGYTPWGTYLTCEENFHGYFWDETIGEGELIGEDQAANNARYGVKETGYGYQWAKTEERFRADLHPHEPNRFGWIVEIDPFDPKSTPVKHTAMGRFKHEGAAFTTGAKGEAVVYMGDDQRFDYVYKFVSAKPWEQEVAAGRSPFTDGTLYVARFDEGGRGEWLALTHGEGDLTAENGFKDQGEVMIKARMAADILGATPMDRPEWTTVHPETNEVFITLTNNTKRTEANAANPRVENKYGHIIKWKEDGDPTGTAFDWDFYLIAGEGKDSGDGSTLEEDHLFGAPDGVWIDPRGIMWIATDGSQPDGSNNQMLVSDPNSGEIKRILTGPVDCEITGLTSTPDGTTFFCNVQHPGDSGTNEDPAATSNWPDFEDGGRPRPAVVAIRRNDGGVVGGSMAVAGASGGTGGGTEADSAAVSESLARTGLGDLAAPLGIGGVTALAAGAGILRFRNRVADQDDKSEN